MLDAVRAGGRLSVVGDTLVCDSGVVRSGRGDPEVVVVPGVVQPVWRVGSSAQMVPAARATTDESNVVAS